MQALSDHFGKNADVHQHVEFDAEGVITLAICEDGIDSRGWTITPLSRPEVRMVSTMDSILPITIHQSNVG